MIAAKQLKQTIASLPEPSGHSQWDNHRRELRRRILNEDPSEFIKWSVIIATMFVGKAPYIPTEQGLAEPVLRMVGMYDTNTVHQAYHLARWLSLGYSMYTPETVVEIGGGYGEMARIWRKAGYRGRYLIYDFPELQALQKFYLEQNGIDDVEFISSLPKQSDFYIALWSLSEIPLDERARLFEGVADTGHLLIAYQDAWEEIDNNAYFKGWPGRIEPIEHLPGNYYLLR